MIKEKDKVQYSTKFLRSIGCYTGNKPFARGVVQGIKNSIATIEWRKELFLDTDNVPEKVHVNNLSLIN